MFQSDFLIPIADAVDAPGLVGIPNIMIFASMVNVDFAAVLEKLLKNERPKQLGFQC